MMPLGHALAHNPQPLHSSLLKLTLYDGNYIIEVWKYPVVSKMGDKSQWVDRLSLVLSLRDDDDPRVEKEVERIISEQKWKD